jgi:hypothetical protein
VSAAEAAPSFVAEAEATSADSAVVSVEMDRIRSTIRVEMCKRWNLHTKYPSGC